MALNIKNEETVRLIRELAEVTGTTQTSAVEQAVAAQLALLGADEHAAERRKRNARARAVLTEIHNTVTAEERAAILQASNDLYDAQGLPA